MQPQHEAGHKPSLLRHRNRKADRVRDLAPRKTQAEIASEAGFANADMMTFLKNGRNKLPPTACPCSRRRWRSTLPC